MFQTCPSSTTLGSGKFHHPYSLRNIYSHFALGLGVYIIGGKPVQSSEAYLSGGADLETLTQRRRGFDGLPQFQSWIAMATCHISREFDGLQWWFPLTLPRLTLPTCFQNIATCAMPRNPGLGLSEPQLLCLKIKQKSTIPSDCLYDIFIWTQT